MLEPVVTKFILERSGSQGRSQEWGWAFFGEPIPFPCHQPPRHFIVFINSFNPWTHLSHSVFILRHRVTCQWHHRWLAFPDYFSLHIIQSSIFSSFKKREGREELKEKGSKPQTNKTPGSVGLKVKCGRFLDLPSKSVLGCLAKSNRLANVCVHSIC